MKRILCCLLLLTLLFVFAGCSFSSNFSSGTYYAADEQYVDGCNPYLFLDTEKNYFRFGASDLISFSEYGNYIVIGNKIFALSQNNRIFIFEIKDANTVLCPKEFIYILGEHTYKDYDIPENTAFVLANENQ